MVQNALFQLARATNMTEGVGYSVNMDLDTLLPRAALNIEMDELNRLSLDPEKFQAWHDHNAGAPFFFAMEKREGSFAQAFGDMKDQMELREMRLGVPLVSNGIFFGIVFIGLGKRRAGRSEGEGQAPHREGHHHHQEDRRRNRAQRSTPCWITNSPIPTWSPKFRTARYVEENLPAFIAKAQKAGQFVVAIMFEYDSYQQIQDTYAAMARAPPCSSSWPVTSAGSSTKTRTLSLVSKAAVSSPLRSTTTKPTLCASAIACSSRSRA